MRLTARNLRPSGFRSAALLITSSLILITARGQGIVDWTVTVPLGFGTMAVSRSGDAYVGGMRNYVVGEQSMKDFVLLKYDSHGNLLWERTVESMELGMGRGEVAGLDSLGNVYVFGTSLVRGTYGPVPDFALGRIFVQKYSSSGSRLWSRTYGGSSTSCGTDLAATDGQGRVYVAGHEQVDMYDCQDTVPGPGANEGSYGLILRYDSYGGETVIKYSGRGGDRVYSCWNLKSDQMGNVYSEWSAGSQCGQNDPNGTSGLLCIVKHGSTGVVVWQQVMSINQKPIERLGGADEEGNWYSYLGVQGDYHLRKYAPSGALSWDSHLGDYPGSIVRADRDGNVYACTNATLVKYNSQGGELWRRQGVSTWRITFDRYGLVHTGGGVFEADGNPEWGGAYGNIGHGADADGCEYGLYSISSPDPSTLTKYIYGKILAPKKGNLWIAGEQDTIRWRASLGDASLDIEYSEDGGSTYQAVASGVRADSLQYVWSLPATTAPKMKNKVKLKKAQQEITFAVSDVFGVKPLIVTRKDTSSGELVTYNYSKDRWGFWNGPEDMWPYLYWYSRFTYNGGMDPFTGQPYPSWDGSLPFASKKDSDFPDWPSFVRAFTVDDCYISVVQAIYSQRAAIRWWSVGQPWGGSCFGIAGTNALAFTKRSSMLSRIPGMLIYDPAQVQSDSLVIPAVTEIFAHQFGNPTRNHRITKALARPTETLRELKAMLRQEETQVRTLSMYNNSGPGGHTILAYWVEHAAEGSPVWNVHVYDNSYPNVADPIIEIDTSQNYGDGSWTPTYGWAGWGGRYKIFLEVPSENYLPPPTLPKRDAHQSPFDVPPGLVEIAGGRDASIRISDRSGNITGYSAGRVWSDIPGSTPLSVTNGSPTPPYGYMLTSGDYSITVDSFKTPESVLHFFTENRTLGYWRSGADSLQRDNLQFDSTGGGTLSVANGDAQTKSVGLKTILSEPGLEKIYTVYDMGLSVSDSALMGPFGSDGLKLISYGQAKDYTIRVEHASAMGLGVFSKTNVPLAANATHMITPEWGTLGGDLTIFVDIGNDGTVDDTLTLKNDLTGTDEHGSVIPDQYRLYQNYPNPFNPLTTIRYGLPQKSAVRLAVYNLLGQEVAVLVQEEKEAGYHEVRFDGSGLASGVYIYRLQARPGSDGEAGTSIQSRKLLLLR